MDIDPVDDGPRQVGNLPPPLPKEPVVSAIITKEEEARQAIEDLKGEDVEAKVAAANKLVSIAATLGVDRTRDVSTNTNGIGICLLLGGCWSYLAVLDVLWDAFLLFLPCMKSDPSICGWMGGCVGVFFFSSH